MRRVPLNLIFDYPVRWSRYKVLRDLIQNFYDSIPRHAWAERFSHRIEQGRLSLVSKGVDFSYDWLIPIGASTKRDGDGDYAGYFGEGFKIAALCALRDFGWSIDVRSRDWHLSVVTDRLLVDGRRLETLAYDVRTGLGHAADTVLCIAPFYDVQALETALLSFYYPDNPLLGEAIWTSSTAAVYHRSDQAKPPDYPATYNDPGPGIIFAGLQALGSFAYPLVVCLHDHRGDDRERNNLYRMDVVKLIDRVAARLPPDAAAAVLRIFTGRWYERPRKRYDFRALGYADLEDACAEADGFTITRDPDLGETRRIAILESVAKTLLPDLMERIELPPCKVIENPCAAWQGMTTCIRVEDASTRWCGLRIRYRLPYVALKATLLQQDGLGDALSTYLHELGHMFGGDSSASFSHALSEMLSATVAHAVQIGDWQRDWVEAGERDGPEPASVQPLPSPRSTP